jgi:prepilin-type processing-associated H-X9-DG protein
MATRLQFRVSRLMILVALAAIGLSLAGVVGEARESARRSQCTNNLKQIGLGLHNYHSAYDCFPAGTVANPSLPPGRRLSWLTVLTGFIEQIFFLFDFHEPWDVPPNRAPMARGVDTPPAPAGENRLLQCPSSGHHSKAAANGPGLTTYVGIAGLGPDAATLPKGDPRCGVFGYDRATATSEITDGTSATMMVVETNTGNGPWTAGGPPTLRAVDPARRPYIGRGRPFGGIHPGGANVLMADGSVRFIKASIDPHVIEAISTIAGGEVMTCDPY